jgi:hypothetical protein
LGVAQGFRCNTFNDGSMIANSIDLSKLFPNNGRWRDLIEISLSSFGDSYAFCAQKCGEFASLHQVV